MGLPKGARLVPGYNDFYAITKSGEIWGCRMWSCRVIGGRYATNRIGPWKKLKLQKCAGYWGANLKRVDGKWRVAYIHYLVLITFVGPRPFNHQCRHLDSNPLNNDLSNLRWGTAVENAADKVLVGRDNRGERHFGAKLNWCKVREIRSLYATGKYMQVELAEMFGVSNGVLSGIVRNLGWKIP